MIECYSTLGTVSNESQEGREFQRSSKKSEYVKSNAHTGKPPFVEVCTSDVELFPIFPLVFLIQVWRSVKMIDVPVYPGSWWTEFFWRWRHQTLFWRRLPVELWAACRVGLRLLTGFVTIKAATKHQRSPFNISRFRGYGLHTKLLIRPHALERGSSQLLLLFPAFAWNVRHQCRLSFLSTTCSGSPLLVWLYRLRERIREPA